jgi:hypothetical protein
MKATNMSVRYTQKIITKQNKTDLATSPLQFPSKQHQRYETTERLPKKGAPVLSDHSVRTNPKLLADSVDEPLVVRDEDHAFVSCHSVTLPGRRIVPKHVPPFHVWSAAIRASRPSISYPTRTTIRSQQNPPCQRHQKGKRKGSFF